MTTLEKLINRKNSEDFVLTLNELAQIPKEKRIDCLGLFNDLEIRNITRYYVNTAEGIAAYTGVKCTHTLGVYRRPKV